MRRGAAGSDAPPTKADQPQTWSHADPGLTPIRTGRPYATAVRIGDLFCRPVLIMRRASSSTEPIASIVKSQWRRVITSGHNGLTSLDSLRPIVQQRPRGPPIDHPVYEILHRSSDREI